GLHPSYADLVPPLLINGVGTGLFTSPNNSAVMGAVRPGRVGTAAGLLATSRNLGMALGTATAAAVIALRLPVHLADQLSPTAARKVANVAGDAVLIALGTRLWNDALGLLRHEVQVKQTEIEAADESGPIELERAVLPGISIRS